MEGCKIEYLDFLNLVSSKTCNWKKNPNEFLNIIEGIKNNIPLKSSLNKISAKNWGLKKQKYQDILKANDLDSIELQL